MKTEDKLIDINYLTTIMNDFKEVRRKEVIYEITPSDRPNSNSMYIAIFMHAPGNKIHRQFTLRISDHLLDECPHKQFLIYPGKELTKKRRNLFIRTLQNVIDSSMIRNTRLTIKNMPIEKEEKEAISLEEFLAQFEVKDGGKDND